jgi:hypothetical protein
MNQRWGRKRDFREIAFLTLVSYMAVTGTNLCHPRFAFPESLDITIYTWHSLQCTSPMYCTLESSISKPVVFLIEHY